MIFLTREEAQFNLQKIQYEHRYCDACGSRLKTRELIIFDPKTGQRQVFGWQHGNHSCSGYSRSEIPYWTVEWGNADKKGSND